MADKGELILERILAILTAIPQQLGYSVHTTWRNRGELAEDKRPAMVLMDGTEENIKLLQTQGSGRVFMSPTVMRLFPQIFVLLKPRDTILNEGVGLELRTFRNAIIKAIAQDKILPQLCGSNGSVSLLRVETDMQTGSTAQGELRIDFAFDYTMNPNDL